MGHKTHHQKLKAKRDVTTPSLETLLSPIKPITKPILHHLPKPKTDLRPLEDRRKYHPDGRQQAAKSIHKATHRLTVKRGPQGRPLKSRPSALRSPVKALSHKIGFHDAKRVLICIRRKMRKQVLHALKLTGKGARSRRHRQSEYSSIRC